MGQEEAGIMTLPKEMPPSAPVPAFEPVAASERISSVDMLRGFALLGILLMNIPVFGLPMAAVDNPTIAGGDDGLNRTVWAVNSAGATAAGNPSATAGVAPASTVGWYTVMETVTLGYRKESF